MRVFLDTNVLASAFATRGLCEDVLRETLLNHEIVISPPLIKELKRVLKNKFKVPESLLKDTVSFLNEDAVVVKNYKKVKISISDKDDVLILSSALEGRAEVFVTGDRELLALRRVNDMLIISPREFWEMTRKK